MPQIEIFTGGELATNAYLLPGKNGYLCFDAPDGLADELKQRKITLTALILTHGHFDHIWDAARIQQEFSCPIWIQEDDAFMLKDPTVFHRFGITGIPPLNDYQLLPVKNKVESLWTYSTSPVTLQGVSLFMIKPRGN
jgi:hydroxyacylglutathione hydrolase